MFKVSSKDTRTMFLLFLLLPLNMYFPAGIGILFISFYDIFFFISFTVSGTSVLVRCILLHIISKNNLFFDR